MKRTIAIVLMLSACAFGQAYMGTQVHNLPDAPSAVKYDVRLDPDTGQYTAYEHVKVFDKWFFLTHGAYLAANIFDIETSVRGKCAEGGSDMPAGNVDRPTRKDLYTQDMIIFAAITGMDVIFKKWIPGGKYIALGPPTYGAVQHARGGIAWYTKPGCM